MVEMLRTAFPLEEAARRICEAVEAVPVLRLAMPGGSAAGALGMARKALGPRWKGVRLTWVDERQVPFDHPDSNRGSSYRLGHLEAGDPPAVELPLFLEGEDSTAACTRVEAGLRRDFDGGLDLLLLGLGEDGHLASLFPGLPWPRGWVHGVEGSPKPPSRRITLGLELLAQAPSALVVAMGETKRQALDNMLRGDPTLPSHALKGLRVVTDLEVNG